MITVPDILHFIKWLRARGMNLGALDTMSDAQLRTLMNEYNKRPAGG